MPKLLSQEEARSIAAKMAAEYGLPPPRITDEESYYQSDNWRVKIELFRQLKMPRKLIPFFKKKVLLRFKDWTSYNYEDGLIALDNELKKLDQRAGVAEVFREKYARQEADEMLHKILQEPEKSK